MKTERVWVDLEIPDGFDLTHEYHSPRKGEWFLSSTGSGYAIKASQDMGERCFILRKLSPPLVPGFLGCVKHNETGEVLFVTRAGDQHLFYVSENGKACSGWVSNTTLYDHPDVPNTPELLQCFEGRN